MAITYPELTEKTPEEMTREIDAVLKDIRNASTTGLHLGCGNELIPELINCDKYSSLSDLKADATDLHVFADSSVDMIEHHHMIEHLSFEQAKTALREWARVLKPNGYLITSCPDIDLIADLWLRYKDTETELEFRDYILKIIYGSQEHDGMYHKSGYNIALLSEMLIRFGFTVDFSYAPYRVDRATPTFILIARKTSYDSVQHNNCDEKAVYTNDYFKSKRLSDYLRSYTSFTDRIAHYIVEHKQEGNCAVYGTGDMCNMLVSASAFKECRFCAVVDRDESKWSECVCGLPVIPLDRIAQYNVKNIVIASIAHKRDIEKRLYSALFEQDIRIIPLDV